MSEVYLSEGKTIDEAIFNGLNKLGISIDEVDIDVVQNETRGVFGLGAKPAVVKLTVRDVTETDVKKMFEQENKPNEPQRRQENTYESKPHYETQRPAREANEGNAQYAPKQRSYNEGYRSNRQNGYRDNRENRDNRDYRDNRDKRDNRNYQKPVVQASTIDYSEEFAANSEAGKFLIELLDKMGCPATVSAGESERGLHLKIDTKEPGALIGHRGETLDAMQYLTQLNVNKNKAQTDFIRVSLDAQGYRVKREEVLKNLARAKASAVRASGKPYKFEPMSPYERRIIHSALQGHPYVTTHSEGDDPKRYVVVTAKQQQYRKRMPQ